MVIGPTGSGKSGLALALAQAFGGVVINADSLQIYRELRILTARPDRDALSRARHRLYGILPARERCSAGHWRRMALAEIAACHAAGKLPLLVGGTGFYLRALEQGLAQVPEIPAAVRAAARSLHRKLGNAEFHAHLGTHDPAMAARLHPSDSQRMIRAWEVLEATGRSLADWQTGGSEPAPYRFLSLLCLPPRPKLYAACDARFRVMVRHGALDEVRNLLALELDPALPAMKALGVPELSRHLAGELDLETAITRAQQSTRNYAKRQMTWLRTQMPPGRPGTVTLTEQYSESFEPEIFNIIRRFLLTE